MHCIDSVSVAAGRCVWDWVQINYSVCVDGDERTCHPVPHCGSMMFVFLRLAISSVITYDILYYNYILQLTQTNWLTLKSLDITREVLHTSSHSCSSNETPKSHSQTHLRAVIVYSLHIPKAFHNILMLHVLHQKPRESCVTFLLILGILNLTQRSFAIHTLIEDISKTEFSEDHTVV